MARNKKAWNGLQNLRDLIYWWEFNVLFWKFLSNSSNVESFRYFTQFISLCKYFLFVGEEWVYYFRGEKWRQPPWLWFHINSIVFHILVYTFNKYLLSSIYIASGDRVDRLKQRTKVTRNRWLLALPFSTQSQRFREYIPLNHVRTYHDSSLYSSYVRFESEHEYHRLGIRSQGIVIRCSCPTATPLRRRTVVFENSTSSYFMALVLKIVLGLRGSQINHTRTERSFSRWKNTHRASFEYTFQFSFEPSRKFSHRFRLLVQRIIIPSSYHFSTIRKWSHRYARPLVDEVSKKGFWNPQVNRNLSFHYSFSKARLFVRSSLVSLHTCLAAFSNPLGDFPLNKSRFGKK